MSQYPVSRRDLQQLIGESVSGRPYLDELHARIRTEDPNFFILSGVQADNAREQLHRQGSISQKELHQLIIDTCVFCFRVRELATLGGAGMHDDKILMADPPLDPTNSGASDAFKDTLMLLEILRTKPTPP